MVSSSSNKFLPKPNDDVYRAPVYQMWSWNSNGKMMTIENNGVAKVQGKAKYTGIMKPGSSRASLVIEYVGKDDFTDYNCTVHNSYGAAGITMKLEGKKRTSKLI